MKNIIDINLLEVKEEELEALKQCAEAYKKSQASYKALESKEAANA